MGIGGLFALLTFSRVNPTDAGPTRGAVRRRIIKLLGYGRGSAAYYCPESSSHMDKNDSQVGYIG
jgi:hypothetical protein